MTPIEASGAHEQGDKARIAGGPGFPSPESTLRPAGAACAERDEGWSSGRYISPEPMLRLPGPAGPEPVESEASRRRGLMTVETAMELAGTGRRAA